MRRSARLAKIPKPPPAPVPWHRPAFRPRVDAFRSCRGAALSQFSRLHHVHSQCRPSLFHRASSERGHRHLGCISADFSLDRAHVTYRRARDACSRDCRDVSAHARGRFFETAQAPALPWISPAHEGEQGAFRAF